MSKEFTVPPVIFPLQRPAHPDPPNTSLPFLSFDSPTSSSAAAAASAASAAYSLPVYASTALFDEEAPLLEELGINTRQIWRKTRSILNPLKLNPNICNLHDEADLSGPFVFFFLVFGLFQLLAGKVHFGIILGWAVVSATFLYVVLNMMAGRGGGLDLYRCVSLVGYCMLPVVLFSGMSLMLPKGGVVLFGMGLMFVLWATRVCTLLLVVESGSGVEDNKGLVSYGCFLIYALFSLLVLF